ncbi:hypothetical protein BOTBODRAFT_38660 [Botryobasidium botryosum FD-172 SS1]|uniref:Aldehyde dehydrogenase n=1 Tax=Botryobasidium botryosum (strain FD-172 SS1) TaxID=930990 RepID=A0A067LW24_BOTB1|nr:hypothetical protein BOTBODRAFT_38660 [Botryobasidium botryosum FD-172 SS1]
MTSKLAYTPLEDIPRIYDAARKGFKTGRARPIAYRKEQLLQLGYMFQENTERFTEALASDLGRPIQETFLLELDPIAGFIKKGYQSVEKWAKPEGIPFDFNFFLAKPKIVKEPKGTVLIIGPFNFPILCTIRPLIGAIAAGCAAVIKPSELIPATSSLFAELIPQYLDSELYKVVNGGVEESTSLLELQWDHILYTGNGNVAKIVAAAAAKHLTPTTLELGGKSPVIIDPKMDLALAARRILWGKVTNAGQICVSPDYVLCPPSAQEELIAGFKAAYKEFYPTPDDMRTSMSRIVAPHHFDRLKKLLDSTSGNIVVGGKSDKADLWIEPTVVKNVKADDVLMQSEIFGPILPIVPMEDLDSAINFINSRDHPLALYVFTNDSQFKSKVVNNTLSGGVVINDVLLQGATADFPIAGVGPSGNGGYGGKAGFDTFTHRRPYMDVPGWLDMLLKPRYAPYTPKKIRALRALGQTNMPRPRPGTNRASFGWKKWLSVAIFVAMIAKSFKYLTARVEE